MENLTEILKFSKSDKAKNTYVSFVDKKVVLLNRPDEFDFSSRLRVKLREMTNGKGYTVLSAEKEVIVRKSETNSIKKAKGEEICQIVEKSNFRIFYANLFFEDSSRGFIFGFKSRAKEVEAEFLWDYLNPKKDFYYEIIDDVLNVYDEQNKEIESKLFSHFKYEPV